MKNLGDHRDSSCLRQCHRPADIELYDIAWYELQQLAIFNDDAVKLLAT